MWWFQTGLLFAILFSLAYIVCLCIKSCRLTLAETIFSGSYYANVLYMLSYKPNDEESYKVNKYSIVESIFSFVFGTIGILIVLFMFYVLLSWIAFIITIIVGGSLVVAEVFYKEFSKD